MKLKPYPFLLLIFFTMQMNAHGDAVNTMYPIGSNGASQAILDAKALTRALIENKYCMEALDAYDKERVPATSMAVLQNRQKGPDFIKELLDEQSPKGFEKGRFQWKRLRES